MTVKLPRGVPRRTNVAKPDATGLRTNHRAKERQSNALPKPSKWRNKHVTVDGLSFDSMVESERYAYNLVRQRAGQIRDLCHHHVFRIVWHGDLICTYEADSTYFLESGVYIVEDVKGGTTTEAFRLKKRMMVSTHRIKITEVRKIKGEWKET